MFSGGSGVETVLRCCRVMTDKPAGRMAGGSTEPGSTHLSPGDVASIQIQVF